MIRVEQAPAAHERDWRWLDEPAPAVVSGLALAALHVTSGAGGGLLTAVPGATTAAGLLALLAVLLVVESAERARPSGPTLPRRSLLWLAAVPGVASAGRWCCPPWPAPPPSPRSCGRWIPRRPGSWSSTG